MDNMLLGPANIDVIGGGNLPGGFAKLFDNQGRLNTNRLRPYLEHPTLSQFATLRKDEWEELDEAVVDIARQRLMGIPDLRAAGLTLTLGGIGTTISQYEQMSDMEDAEVSMSVRSRGDEDRTTYTLVSVPVPVFHKEFRLDARTLDASRRLGSSLDTTMAQTAARKVTDQLENTLFNGASNIVVNANPLYGYTTHANRNTVTATGDWGTIGNIFTDVNAMVAAAEADNYFGPYTLYVAKTQYGEMRAIYGDGSQESAYERCLRAIPELTAIKPGDSLAAGSVLLVTMRRDVVDLALALDVQTIQWDTMGGMETRFMVLAIMAARIKADADGRSGIVHLTGA